MIIVVCRKQIKGSVCENVRLHNTGGINILKTRIPLQTGEDTSVAPSKSIDPNKKESGVWKQGRWPANVFLTTPTQQKLDEQSGIQVSGMAGNSSRGWGVANDVSLTTWKSYDSCGYGDTGGASRYFKVLDTHQELVDYLHTMITPTQINGKCLVILENLNTHDFTQYDTEHFHSVIVKGTPTEIVGQELHRVCKPGSFLMLMSTPEEPTGAIGACVLEDIGFQIRDSIFHMDEHNSQFMYSTKASKNERTQGTHNIDLGGLKHGNFHPTVKPITIMEWCLQDIPTDSIVIDPFLGSGTTGVACTKTKHNFIGIELNPEYIQICDARVRHWNTHYNAWNPISITSDVIVEEKPSETITLENLLGLE